MLRLPVVEKHTVRDRPGATIRSWIRLRRSVAGYSRLNCARCSSVMVRPRML